jgi:pyrimidine 5'-nucleotidase
MSSSSSSSLSSLQCQWMDLVLFGVSTVAYMAFVVTMDASTMLTKALEAGTSLNAKERVCTVDDGNQPTPHGHLRKEMRLENLWHRATYVLVVLVGDDSSEDHQQQQQSKDNSSVLSSNCSPDHPMDVTVIVQKRSQLKDYCPGKLDPTPGGVVAYGETYLQNAMRELEEEMGITTVVTTSSSDDKNTTATNTNTNTLTRLFTFPYQDDRVRVFGEFFECRYHGKVQDLVLQSDEVESVQTMTLSQLQELLATNPDLFMPDACHAMQLYFQRQQDTRLQRRLLKGYSSGNLDHYKLRPKPKVIFFDCDDCLYFDDWNVANMLTRKIEDWCVNQAGLQPGQAYELYKQYGTALKGLLQEGYLENNATAIDNYLQQVHDIHVEQYIARDDVLRTMILRMDPTIPRYIFTASVREHAQRCLQALGIDDLFHGIIDVKDCQLETKHSTKSFEIAMQIAGIDVQDGESCLFVDDSLKNIDTARQMKWRSVLVGKVGRDCGTVISSEHAEQEIDRIHDFPTVWPELFL